MNRAATGATLILGISLAAALFGGAIPPLDSLAVAQPYLAGLLLLVLAVSARRAARPIGATLVILIGIAGWDVLRHAVPDRSGAGPGLVHLQHNLHPGNRAPDLLDRMAGADLVTLQEVGEAIHSLVERDDDWHLRICPRPGRVTTTALTRLPVIEDGCTPSGAAWIRMRMPGCEGGAHMLTLVSIHLFRPWPSFGDRQARQVDGLMAEIAALPQPVLLGGDFNQMPWSHTAGRLAEAAGGRILGGLRATYVQGGGLLRLPIDHVVLGGGLTGTTARGGLHGSDHHALSTRVSFPGAWGCPGSKSAADRAQSSES